MNRPFSLRPPMALLAVGLVTSAFAMAGCQADDPVPSPGQGTPADPAGALPPAPIAYADPGSVADYTQRGYDALVDEIHGGEHPDALFFWGVLPCADCPGIRTKLTLVPDERLYVLRQTYLEADEGRDATFTTVGTWTEDPGVLDARPDAPVLRLEASEGAPPQLMLARIAVDTLRLLDRQGRWIDSDLPYELVRVED